MKVTSLGHAGLKVDTAGATVLVDPWVSPQGAFQASWFPYPDNSHLVTPALFEPAAVIVSHEHLDHLDPWFLAQVPSHVPVIIPRYPSPLLRRKVLSAGVRNIFEASAWEPMVLPGGGKLFFVPEASPVNHDAAIVIQAGGHTMLNMNDARLSPMQLRDIRTKVGGIIDLLCLQSAGASWYPLCYEYPGAHRRRLSSSKRLAKLAYVARTIRVVEPLKVIPFAGPPCFLDQELFSYNEEMEAGIFPDPEQVARWLAEHGIKNTVILLPGDTWDCVSGAKEPDPVWKDFSWTDRLPYLSAYARRRRLDIERVKAEHPEPRECLWKPFRDYFERHLAMSHYFNTKINMRVGFDIIGPGGGEWAVDFRPGMEGVFEQLGDCSYRYRFDSRWLPGLLSGTVPWEDFFLSLRFHAWREPDLYNDHLLCLLKFADAEALDAIERFQTSMNTDERIIIDAEGQTYRIQRYCPHGGVDLLETGEILPGRVLRCLGHHYEFALENGECINGRCPPLITERVGKT